MLAQAGSCSHCTCRKANSDNDRDGEVDQPPRKLQKIEAACHETHAVRPEAQEDSREALKHHKPPQPKEQPAVQSHSGEALNKQDPPRPKNQPSEGNKEAAESFSISAHVSRAANEQESLPGSQKVLLPGATCRADGKVQIEGPLDSVRHTEHSATSSAAVVGEGDTHQQQRKRPFSQALDHGSREMPSEVCRGLRLSAVVAACNGGQDHEITSEEERDRKVAGSRGSSQTRT